MSNCPIARRNNILYTRQNRYSSKTILFLLGILNIIFSPVSNAQITAPRSSNTEPNSFSSQPSNIKPIQQPGSFFDSNSSGSQQFFQQDTEQLYFLPEEKSEPILQIDEDIKEEEVKDNATHQEAEELDNKE